MRHALCALRFSGDGIIMIKKIFCIAFFLSLISILGLGGCASKDPQLTSLKKNTEYRQMLERQKASAEEQIEKKLPPLDAVGYERLGDRYLLQGKPEFAYKQYLEALNLNPVQEHQERLHYKIGRLFLQKGMLDEAKQEFQGILQKNAGHSLAQEGMGRVFFVSRDYAAAKSYFLQALKNDPKLWESHNFLGIILDKEGQYDEAMNHFLAAIQIKPDVSDLYNNLGICLYLKGDYEKAILAFNEALKIEPSNSRFHNNRGLALSKLGRYQEAVEAFKKGGDDASAYYNLGCVYMIQGKYAESIEAFQKAIDIKPDFHVNALENIRKAKAALNKPASK